MTAAPPRSPHFGLRVLATSDLHMQITPWDYLTDRAAPGQGLAHTARLIAAARAEVANSLLFDNGDVLQGSPMGDWAAQRGAGRLHPMIAAMNALGYDAATLGNHEFSHGLPLLKGAMAAAQFPFVSANILHSDGRPFCPPFLILDHILRGEDGSDHPIRIGVTGFAPPQTKLWETRSMAGRLVTRDILDSARSAVTALRGAGADVIVALAHTGIDLSPPSPWMENAAVPLAALEGIDALVTGHTHLLFPEPGMARGMAPATHPLTDKPVVMPGFHGAHLGIIDLTLIRHDHGWQVTRHHAHLRSLADLAAAGPPDPAVMRAVAPAHRATRRWMSRPIGESDHALHTYFALLAPSAALRLVSAAQSRLVAAHLHGTPYADLPLLSAVAPFKAGGRGGPGNYTDIPAGQLCLRHMVDLYQHPNTLLALHLTGAELADWLERAVAIYHQITPGARDVPLIRPDMPSFDVDLIDALTFRIDLSQPARFDARGVKIHPTARRITGLAHQGRTVSPTDRFILATNSHRGVGGGGFAGTGPDRIILDTATPTRDALCAHVASGGARAAGPVLPNWGFSPMPNTKVTFDTAPAALNHLDDVPYSAEPMGLTDQGFLRFRLRL